MILLNSIHYETQLVMCIHRNGQWLEHIIDLKLDIFRNRIRRNKRFSFSIVITPSLP